MSVIVHSVSDMNAPSPSRTVAANARAEIARRGLTQEVVAEAMGLNRVTLGRRLSGQLPLTVDELITLAHVLDVSVDVLLAGADPTEAASA